MSEQTTITVKLGDEGIAEIKMPDDASVSEWLEAFDKMLMFAGFHPVSIANAFAEYGVDLQVIYDLTKLDENGELEPE